MQKEEPSSQFTTREFSDKGIEYSPGTCATIQLTNDIGMHPIHFAAIEGNKLIVCYNTMIDILDLTESIVPTLTHRLTGIHSAPTAFCLAHSKLIVAIKNKVAFWDLDIIREVKTSRTPKTSPRKARSASLSLPYRRSSGSITSIKPRKHSNDRTNQRRFFSSRSASPSDESPPEVSPITYKKGDPTQTYIAGDNNTVKQIMMIDQESFITIHNKGVVRYWNQLALFNFHEIQFPGDILACNLQTETGIPLFAVRQEHQIKIYRYEKGAHITKVNQKNTADIELIDSFDVQQTVSHASMNTVLLTPNAKLMIFYTNARNKECFCLHVQNKGKPEPAQLINRAVEAINEHEYRIMPCGEIVIWKSSSSKVGQPLEIVIANHGENTKLTFGTRR